MTMLMTDAIRLFLFPLLMAFSAFSDLFTMTISNRVSILLIAGFAVMAALIGMNLSDILLHAGAGCIGGGDGMLAAATALWLGFGTLLEYLLTASIFGGALTLVIMRFRLMPMPALLQGQEWAMRLHRVDAGVPYGIALAAAALTVYPHTIWMKPLGL